MQFEVTQDFVQQLEDAIAARDVEYITGTLNELYPADICLILYRLDNADAKYILELLEHEEGAEVIRELEDEFRKKFLRDFSPQEIASYIRYIDSDDAVDILNEQAIQTREEVLPLIENREKANHIRDLLHYEEDCAGGLMAKELIKVNINMSVNECIEEIRRQSRSVEKVFSVYVVDDTDKLLGVISLKRILLEEGNLLVGDIYNPEIIVVETYREAEEVANVMQKYDLESVPVVNVHGKLLGRITIDDVVDVITEQAELERQIMSGISESTEENAGVFRLSRARLPWLMIGMVGGILGAKFIGLFESDISAIPAMAFFIPLITATGGNVGIQSSSLVVQWLANRGLGSFDKGRMTKGFLVSVVNGVAISVLVFLLNIALGEEMRLALVVSIALLCVVILASLLGTITPLILDRFGINPALASGPFITTANDLLGLAIYFLVAHTLYHF